MVMRRKGSPWTQRTTPFSLCEVVPRPPGHHGLKMALARGPLLRLRFPCLGLMCVPLSELDSILVTIKACVPQGKQRWSVTLHDRSMCSRSPPHPLNKPAAATHHKQHHL